MIGTIVWNIVIGSVSGLMTFLFAMMNHNLLSTALLRGLIALLVMFLLTFVFRFLIALILTDTGMIGNAEKEGQEGSTIDLATPEDDIELPSLQEDKQSDAKQEDDAEVSSSQRATEQEPFQPFAPPRIVKSDGGDEQQQPEQLAQAVRRLTEQ